MSTKSADGNDECPAQDASRVCEGFFATNNATEENLQKSSQSAVVVPKRCLSTAESKGSTKVTPSTSVRRSIRRFFPQQHLVIRTMSPEAPRRSLRMLERAASFHKKVLKATVNSSALASYLKLSTIKSKDIVTLAMVIRMAVLLGPVLQIIWIVWVEPDIAVLDTDVKVFEVSRGDAFEASIQIVIMLMTGLYIRRMLKDPKREVIQVILVMLMSLAGVVGALTLVSDVAKSHRDHSKRGRHLLSFANAILATFLYCTLAVLTDYFAEILLSANNDFESDKLHRLRDRSRYLSMFFNASVGLYLVARLLLTWRTTAVFDFIPIANIITVLRLRYLEEKLISTTVFTNAIVISALDAVMIAVAFIKCSFTHRLFKYIFVRDFAKWYTEYRVFVVDFRSALTIITVAGHVAAWTVPFYHTIVPDHLAQKEIQVQSLGSVQMQLGFRLSLMLWLIAVMYCALPRTSRGLGGWIKAAEQRVEVDHRVKYFLYASDVHIKTGFRNLTKITHSDGQRFIVEHQVEAFNFAQLVYARGNKNYDQHSDSLIRLVEDQHYTVVAVIHDAKTDTHCLVLSADAKIVVTFRGTLSKTNAKTDLQSSMTIHNGADELILPQRHGSRQHQREGHESRPRTLWHRLRCKLNPPRVHSGFYAAYSTVADRVLNAVSHLYCDEARPILVTGHSLGGALAALCSFDIATRLKISDVSCTTFGCPRIGNNAFRKRYNLMVPATFAFINASDMITKLPPKTPKAQSYASVGKIVLLNSFGNLVIEPNTLELEVLHRGYSGKAHTMRAYHLSLLLWCLRFHKNQYQPKFWRQSLMLLRTEYGHLPEVRVYLDNAMVKSSGGPASVEQVHLLPSGASMKMSTRRQLLHIARQLEAALWRQRANDEVESISSVWLAELWGWLRPVGATEWYSSADAVKFLKSELKLGNDATALELIQSLALHGFIELEKPMLALHSRIAFSLLDEDDGEEEESDPLDDRDALQQN